MLLYHLANCAIRILLVKLRKVEMSIHLKIPFPDIASIYVPGEGLCDAVLRWCEINGLEDLVQFYFQISNPIVEFVAGVMDVPPPENDDGYSCLNSLVKEDIPDFLKEPLSHERIGFNRVAFINFMVEKGAYLEIDVIDYPRE